SIGAPVTSAAPGAALGDGAAFDGDGAARSSLGGAGAAAVDCAGFAAVASRASNVRMTEPSLTLSPTLSFKSLTTPDVGAGTSIVALSDSSVTSGSSASTLSPGLTNTSMTGTFLKSPMSGTLTSCMPL